MSTNRFPVVVLVCADAEWVTIRNLFSESDFQQTLYGDCLTVFINKNFPGEGYSLDNFNNKDHELIPILFIHTGWGKIAAAGATQYAIDAWSPNLIVNIGTCGGFEGVIKRDQIILANRTIVYDILEQMGDQEAHIQHYATNIDLDWCNKIDLSEIQTGLLISGDRDLIVEEIPVLHHKYGAIAGDWESGAIAYVAARNQVRVLILRGVSDLVGSQGGEAYQNIAVFHISADRIMRRLLEILPGFILSALS